MNDPLFIAILFFVVFYLKTANNPTLNWEVEIMKHIAWDFGATDAVFADLGLPVVQQKTCKTLCGKRAIVINALPFPSHADDVECDECLTIADECEAIEELLSK